MRRSSRSQAPDPSAHASDLDFVVFQLNQLMDLDLTLVAFDEKSPGELMQLLNDVFALIDPKQKKDLRDEPPDQTLMRMMDFTLRILYYKPNMDINDFRNGFAAADKSVIVPILFWLLSKMNDLKKRVYLAKYLTPMDVPEEYLVEEDLRAVHAQHKQMQDEFKEIHKSVDKLRVDMELPDEIRKNVSAMEEEKEKLTAKIAAVKRKVQEIPNYEELLAVGSGLRKEQEEAQKLSERLVEQEQHLQNSDQRMQLVSQRLKDTKRELGDASIDSLLTRLQDETQRNRVIVRDKLPKDLASLQDKMDVMQRAQFETLDADEIQADVRRLQLEISQLQEKIAQAQPKDEKSSLYARQAAMVAKKKEEISKQLDGLAEERNKLESEHSEKEREADSTKDSKVMKGEEFKKYAGNVRARSTQYKKMKAELAEIRSELGVLMRTEEVLKSRDSNLQEYLEELAKRKGVSGFKSTQDTLEKISAQKAEVDEEKGKTLEEISKYVTEIANSIKDRKNKLAPQIVELRTTRQQFQELEQEFLEKKASYENTAAGLESEKSRLEQDVETLTEECAQAESLFHLLTAQMKVTQSQQKRSDDEVDFRTNKRRLSDQHKTYQEMLTAKVQQLEALSKDLRDKQRYVKENYEPNMKQITMFQNVKKLLAAKAALYKQQFALEGEPGSGSYRHQGFDMMDMGQSMGGVDRLVL